MGIDNFKKVGINNIHQLRDFISVVSEHCLSKGMTDLNEIYKCWIEHKESMKKVWERK